MGICDSGNANMIENPISDIPKPIPSLSLSHLDKITEQMSKSICKIIENEKIKGTGFLCLIPNPNINHLLKVLITCNHVLNNIKKGNKIKLTFEDGTEQILILDDSRKIYTNKNYDCTII